MSKKNPTTYNTYVCGSSKLNAYSCLPEWIVLNPSSELSSSKRNKKKTKILSLKVYILWQQSSWMLFVIIATCFHLIDQSSNPNFIICSGWKKPLFFTFLITKIGMMNTYTYRLFYFNEKKIQIEKKFFYQIQYLTKGSGILTTNCLSVHKLKTNFFKLPVLGEYWLSWGNYSCCTQEAEVGGPLQGFKASQWGPCQGEVGFQ